MDNEIKVLVGLDVHQESIAIAYADAHSQQEPRFIGTIGATANAVLKALRTLGDAADIAVCYEAGPCGYNLVRALAEQGIRCQVVAPSRVARQPADRIKTDRRDALLLARLFRAGELTAIVVPDPADEAIRDLMRSREDAVNARRRSRQQLRSFLVRYGHVYHGVRAWGPAHDRWMAIIAFPNVAQHLVFTDYRLSVRSGDERLARIEASVREQVEHWRWRPVVRALMTMRGIDLISATTIIAELGDLRRFEHPRDFMEYLGLVPSEYSSGNSQRRGSLTRTGNGHVRRILIEASWSYRLPVRIGESLAPRQAGQPQCIVETAWKAQVRLCARFRRLRARVTPKQSLCSDCAGTVWIYLGHCPQRPTPACLIGRSVTEDYDCSEVSTGKPSTNNTTAPVTRSAGAMRGTLEIFL